MHYLKYELIPMKESNYVRSPLGLSEEECLRGTRKNKKSDIFKAINNFIKEKVLGWSNCCSLCTNDGCLYGRVS